MASVAARARALFSLADIVTPPTIARRRRLVIDCDPGVDDSFALALALTAPEFAVEGITIVSGNSPNLDVMARNALYMTTMCNKHGVPVILGARQPLTGEFRGQGGALCHGALGFGDVPLPDDLDLGPIERDSDVLACDFIAKTVTNSPGEVSVVALGPLTNVALACPLTRGFGSSLEHLSWMGGAVFVPGNITPSSEFNAICDPDAVASTLLRVSSPIVISALDITTQLPFTAEFLERVRSASPLGDLLERISRKYTGALAALGHRAFVHDAVAVMAMLRPELFQAERVRLEVVVDGPEAGRTVGSTDGAGEDDPIVITGVDAPAFYDEFVRRIAAV